MTKQPTPPSGPRRRELTVDDYVRGVREHSRTILARALTLVESSLPRHQRLAEEVLAQLLPLTGGTIRVGITGVPGAGKSTFIETLGYFLVEQGHRVAVMAVDSSSDLTGGSILGDKTRMTRLASHEHAFIRPSPTAGTLGGVARKTRESILVCEAAGYDVILIETVGVGQSETMVAHMTDCFVALVLSGAGDDLQGIKRGLLEMVDMILVNKAEGDNRPAAELTAGQYRAALRFFAGKDGTNLNVVLTCSALANEGITTAWQAIVERQNELTRTGRLAERRCRQSLHWLWTTVQDRLKLAILQHLEAQDLRAELERQVLEGEITVEAAARKILQACGLELQ